MTKLYRSSIEHIIDELQVVDAFIQRKFDSMKQSSNSDNDELSGLIISDLEIENSLKNLRKEKSDFSQIPQNSDEEIHALKEQIDLSVQNSSSTTLRLQSLVEKFHLSSFEKMILLFCLAPEFDKRYSTIYAFLQNNITKKFPSSQMLLDVICDSIMERLSVHIYFSQESPLFKYGIVRNSSDNDDEFHALSLDKSIMQYLLDHDKIDSTIDNVAHLEKNLEPVKIINKNLVTKLEHVFKLNAEQNDKIFIVLAGLDPISKKNIVTTLAHHLNLNLLNVDMSLLKQQKNFEISCRILMRESILHDATLYFENFDDISDFQYVNEFFSLINRLYVNSNIILIDMKNSKNLEILSSLNTYVIEVPHLTFSETKFLWKQYLGNIFPIK